MLTVRRSFYAIALLSAALGVGGDVRADTRHAAPMELAFFGGDDIAIGKDRPLIRDLSASDLALSGIAGPAPARDLVRRETSGPDRVLVPLPKAKRFAEDVMRRIINGAGVTGFEPKIEIVSDEEINAAAYPDGTILVTLGVFRNLKSADELAAVLAHEFAHILLRHHSSDWFMDAQGRGLAIYKLVLDVKSYLDKMNQGETADSQFKDLKNRMIAETVVMASEILVDTPFDQHQEDQADLLGADLLIKANYNPLGLDGMFESLELQEADAKAQKEAHKQLRRKNISLSQDSGFFSSISSAFGDIVVDIKSELMDQFAKEHRDAGERRDMVTAYLDTHYTDPIMVALSEAPWQALVNDRDVKRVLDGYRAALDARKILSTYSLDEAAKLSRDALDALDEEHSLPRKVAAEISFIAKDYERAARFLTESAKGYGPSIGVYQGLAETHLQLGDPEAAVAAINFAAAELQDPPQLLPSKIAMRNALIGSGRKPADKVEMVGLMAQCRIDGMNGLDLLCEEAAKGEFSVFNIDLPTGQKLKPVDPGTPKAKVASLGAPKRSSAPISHYVQIAEQSLRARGGPGTNHGVVGSYSYAEKLGVIGRAKASNGWEWLNVRDGRGNESWIAAKFSVKDGELQAKKPAPVASAPQPAPAPAPAAAPKTTPKADEASAPSEPAKQASAPDSVETRLLEAKKLHEKGILTDDEYKAARKQILKDL